VIVHGHPTSVGLEPAFWHWLRIIAAEYGITVKKFVECVVAAKGANCPLSSALRVYIADYFYRQAPYTGFVDPNGRLAFTVESRARLATAPKRASERASKSKTAN
jgi:predicted DNA-binding ribbon-helix-helix protein